MPFASTRILHIVDSLETGGLERFVCDLAIAQQAAGHTVAVFSLVETAGFRAVLEGAGIAVLIGGKRSGLDLALLRRLRALISAHDVEVVHSHDFVPSYYAALGVLGTGLALVNTCHNMGARLAQRRLRWLYRLSLLRSGRVATVGEAARAALIGLGVVPAAKAVAMRNGIPVERFRIDAAAREQARAALGLAPDEFVIGCVGRLVTLKNHSLLISQLPSLLAVVPELRLVLVGDGPLAAELKARAADLGVLGQVLFAGGRSDVSMLLPGFDVFCLPSTTEGLSIALLEACASGCAIVASAVGGNPQIIEDGVNGRLFCNNEGEALRSLLLQLAKDPAERARLGAAARAYAEREASMQAVVEAYARLYAEAGAG
jgi:glycosyltransferase involved in cell wall biosynthesis